MAKDIGKTLKECRSSAKMSVKDISDILTDKGYKASESTIYSWENGNSQPTPGALLTMCTAYGIDDVLATFGYDGYKEDGSIQLNLKEIGHIEKYRNLDDNGRTHVDTVLDWETQRMELYKQALAEREQQKPQIVEIEKVAPPRYSIIYYQRLASAGTGEYLFNDIPTDIIEVLDTPIARRADFALGVNGNSMEPTYYDGDKVYVEITDEIPTGSIGIFTRGNECLIKELGTDRLISHNKEYGDIPAREDIKLVGLVLGKVAEV
mgnify:CR=1 FL=1